jgi:hypothetical protein
VLIHVGDFSLFADREAGHHTRRRAYRSYNLQINKHAENKHVQTHKHKQTDKKKTRRRSTQNAHTLCYALEAK